MKLLKGTLILILALALLAALGWAGLHAMEFLRAKYLSLAPEGAALATLFAALALACTLYLGWSMRASQASSARASLSERASAYLEFVSLWFPLSASGKPQAEWPLEWRRLQPRLALLAGDRVLKQYQRLLRQAAAQPGDPATAKAAESVVLEMRKDLGAMNRDWDPRAWRKLLGGA